MNEQPINSKSFLSSHKEFIISFFTFTFILLVVIFFTGSSSKQEIQSANDLQDIKVYKDANTMDL